MSRTIIAAVSVKMKADKKVQMQLGEFWVQKSNWFVYRKKTTLANFQIQNFIVSFFIKNYNLFKLFCF